MEILNKCCQVKLNVLNFDRMFQHIPKLFFLPKTETAY